ncbi:MAG: response regulator transcription factor, partial [Acidimicrobiia bacterium]
MTRATVVVVDDHEIVRAGASKFLVERFDVVGEAGDVDEAVEVITRLEPDIVLIDVTLPSGTGADVVLTVQRNGT